MATRFYLSANDKSCPCIVTPDVGWELNTGYKSSRLVTSKIATPLVQWGTAETSTSGTYDVLVAQFISAPLQVQTITGTVKGIIRTFESNAAADMRAQMNIRVVDELGSTVRGTLLTYDASVLTSEFDATTYTNRKFPLAWSAPGTNLSSVTTTAFDRIVIEIGYRAHNTVSTSYTGSMEFGDAILNDLAEDEVSTDAYSPWIEFSQTLNFMTDATSVRGNTSLHVPFVQNALKGYVSYYDIKPIGDGLFTEVNIETISGTLVGKFSNNPDDQYPSVDTAAPITYKMIGRASGIWVSWTSTGSPDFAGDEYTGPGTLDLSTISVSS